MIDAPRISGAPPASSLGARRLPAPRRRGVGRHASGSDARAGNPNCSSLPGTIVSWAPGQRAAAAPHPDRHAAREARLADLGCPSDSGARAPGYNDLVTPTSITTSPLGRPGASPCQLDAGGDPVTFAVSGERPQNSCSGVTVNRRWVFRVPWPVQPIDFVVPSGSSQQSISTEAAYYIWGFGASDAAHTVSPWGTSADAFPRAGRRACPQRTPSSASTRGPCGRRRAGRPDGDARGAQPGDGLR